MYRLLFRDSPSPSLSPSGAAVPSLPAEAFRIERGEVVGLVEGLPRVAVRDGDRWVMNGTPYVRFDCSEPVSIRYEDRARSDFDVSGEFKQVGWREGAVFADGRAVARETGDGRWARPDEPTLWPTLVLQGMPSFIAENI